MNPERVKHWKGVVVDPETGLDIQCPPLLLKHFLIYCDMGNQ